MATPDVPCAVPGTGTGTATGTRSRNDDHRPFSRVTLHRLYNPPRDRNGDVMHGIKRMNQYADAVLYRLVLGAGAGAAPLPSARMCGTGEWVIDCVGSSVALASDGSDEHKQAEGAEGAEGGAAAAPADACTAASPTIAIVDVGRSDWDVTSVTLEVRSRRMCARQLMAWVERTHDEYSAALNHDLGTKLYFFDQKDRYGADPRGDPFASSGSIDAARQRLRFELANAPKNLTFVKLPFQSNKTFDNLCGPEVETLRRRIEFFANNRAWYDAKGVPYQLGVLLSGEPGAGKSSCIRAMANYLRRHIINVNFASIRTVTQLKHLFYSGTVHVYSDNNAMTETVRLHVPPNRAIFVLEEIDAVGGGGVVLQRGLQGTAGAGTGLGLGAGAGRKEGRKGFGLSAGAEPDEVTLGEILQVLDGNLETPGRIIVITSNHPELLDSALVRPGRVDVSLRFGLASRATIAQMYAKLHDAALPERLAPELPHCQVSPAEAAECMLRNLHEPDRIVADLRRVAEAREAHRASTSTSSSSSSSSSTTTTTTHDLASASSSASVSSSSASRGPVVEMRRGEAQAPTTEDDAAPAWWQAANAPLAGHAFVA